MVRNRFGPWGAFFKGCILFPSLVRTAACAAKFGQIQRQGVSFHGTVDPAASEQWVCPSKRAGPGRSWCRQ